MEVRSLARSLRARPSPWLLSSRQRHILFTPTNTLRYSSSGSPSRSPPAPSESSPENSTTTTTTTTTTAEQAPTSTPAKQPTLETTSQPNPSPQESSNSTTENAKSDFDDILNKLNLGSRARPRAANPEASSDKGQSIRRIFPDSKQFLSQAVRQSATTLRGTDNSKWNAAAPSRKVELKLGPTLGRQQLVTPERGTDLAAAIRNLEIACSVNKIKQQSFRQRQHTRRGVQLKQLRMERWRKLFRFSFQETVKKIKRMQAQGW